MVIHVVKEGETAYSIASQYGVSLEKLLIDNGLGNNPNLVVGEAILVLFPDQVHTVKQGETIYQIAQQYGISVNQLYRNNYNLMGNPDLYPGQTLVISYEGEKEGRMQVNGYAYPYIDKQLLRATLPYLTYLTPFTYGITPQGGLVDLDDGALIALGKEYGVKLLMHLSTLTEEGNFSNELASVILNNPEVQSRLIENILANMKQKGYDGLDVDFEFVYRQDKEKYAEFVQNLTNRLNPEGYEVIAALAPKISPDQPGQLYEGHDYELIGAAANAVLLMTYEWGYTYGPPLAVSPLPNVRQVLDYAITEIPPEKIFQGMPNYGYDWTLPFVKGESRARLIGNREAVDIARQFGVPIFFDEVSQAPHFNYYDWGGNLHEVWFEDARSIRAKLALVPEYGFRGVGYWNLMRPFPQNWLLLNALYEIEQG